MNASSDAARWLPIGRFSIVAPRQLRADYIKRQLERTAPVLAQRMIANGVGSRETLVGNGRDDASDALDRRRIQGGQLLRRHA